VTICGGLDTIASQLGMERIHGPAHQAWVSRPCCLGGGVVLTMMQAESDSLLTAKVFYEMRRRYFEGEAVAEFPRSRCRTNRFSQAKLTTAST